jgi:type IV fimbrial biogenesis protein FimT
MCWRRGRAGSVGPKGFTLVELMVTTAVAAILMAVAVPAFRTFLQNDRAMTQSTSLILSLNTARSEAIKQDVATGVWVCASTDGLTCAGSAAAWAQGWIVLSSVANSVPTVVVPSLSTQTTLSEAANLALVTFYSSGVVQAPAAFTLCDSRGATKARYIQVTVTGRVSSAVGKDLAGNALTCP